MTKKNRPNSIKLKRIYIIYLFKLMGLKLLILKTNNKFLLHLNR